MINATLILDIPSSELEHWIARLARGEQLPLKLAVLLQNAVPPAPPDLSPLGQLLAERGLSPRQIEIIELDQENLSRVAIARRLGIGLRTVDWHMEIVKRKLGVDSITEVRSWIAALRADL